MNHPTSLPAGADLVLNLVETHLAATERVRRMEALSLKLSVELAPGQRERVFDGSNADAIRFVERRLTILHADEAGSPHLGDNDFDSVIAEVEWLAARHQGRVDRFSHRALVAFFDAPRDCVRMAMDLQRCAGDLHLRMGLHTGICEVALFYCEGIQQFTLIGDQPAVASSIAATAASGSIALSPQTYALVREDIHIDAPGCLLMEEFHDSDLASVSLTPAPVRGEHALSTFAGLGR